MNILIFTIIALLLLTLNADAKPVPCIDVIAFCEKETNSLLSTPFKTPSRTCKQMLDYINLYSCLEKHFDPCIEDFKFKDAISYDMTKNVREHCILGQETEEACKEVCPIGLALTKKIKDILHEPCKTDFEICVGKSDDEAYRDESFPSLLPICKRYQFAKEVKRVETWECLANSDVISKCWQSHNYTDEKFDFTRLFVVGQSNRNCIHKVTDGNSSCNSDCVKSKGLRDTWQNGLHEFLVSKHEEESTLTSNIDIESNGAQQSIFTYIVAVLLIMAVHMG